MASVILPQPMREQGQRIAVADRDLGDQFEGLAPHPAEFFGIAVIMLMYAIAMFDGYAMVDVVNIVGPVMFIIIIGFAAVRLTRLNIHAIWTPVFWYRVAMVVYMGIGSSMTSFYNADTRDLINAFFAFSPNELLKFNMVNATFHLCFITVSWLVIRIYRSSRNPLSLKQVAIDTCRIPLKAVGLVFLTVGVTFNYLVVYPAALGILKITIPNALVQFGQFAYIGYFLLTYWGLANKKYSWVVAIMALAAIDSIAGIFQLTKAMALFPVMMIPIAFLYHKSTLRRILITLAFIAPYYAFVSSVVEEARSRVLRDSGDANRAIFSDTIVVMGDIFKGKNGNADAPEYQLAWARLNYVNAGTLAINFYDQGLEGHSLRDIFIVWIPRAIYPDKPIITDIGRDFTVMANGNYDSSTSPSMPAEGYWNFGWLGVALFAALLSTVLTLWSIYSTIVFDRDAWHLLLVVLLGMRVGTRIDGFLVVDVVGPLSAVLAIHVACTLANRFLPKIPALQRRFVA
ncbi:hypothetical protein [Sphingomonas bacterium]|uniref:hypothetical protein n=1 Tax=Sphingomonas bacterium TaxID=1895847 RepID=UPI0026330581|nr:hypothetical protein [Sphingomonas bacterium]MDB5677664.1 hypothetical protein [Sphingomonas bacterium]